MVRWYTTGTKTMKKINKITLLLICIFSIFAASFSIIPPTKNDIETKDNVSLEGMSWSIDNGDYYCIIKFISDRTVIMEGWYYNEDGEAVGAWGSTFHYYYDGVRGQLWTGDRNDTRSRMVGAFRYEINKYEAVEAPAGDPIILNLNRGMEPTEGELLLYR